MNIWKSTKHRLYPKVQNWMILPRKVLKTKKRMSLPRKHQHMVMKMMENDERGLREQSKREKQNQRMIVQ